MCYVLHKHRLNVGVTISRRFDQSVLNLIKYILATGLLTRWVLSAWMSNVGIELFHSCAFILFIVLASLLLCHHSLSYSAFHLVYSPAQFNLLHRRNVLCNEM